MARSEPTPIARALGRIPSGLYIVTSEDAGAPVGFVGSLLQQVGFEPPSVCLALAKNRGLLEILRRRGRFAVSVLDGESRGVMAAFLKRSDVSPFDKVAVVATASGLQVVSSALAWFECTVSGEHDTGDHVVLFGEVVDGSIAREGEPTIHTRKNGLSY
jgi:3-hydroxy-9,10-secoandrosta-1,3,5(10)-triene-9,17-dione monooxygenase reductase component